MQNSRMNKERKLKLSRSDLFEILDSIEELEKEELFNAMRKFRMPAYDQSIAIEYYAKTGKNIVLEWFTLKKLIYLVRINFVGGEFNIENGLIDEFDVFVTKEEMVTFEKLINGESDWDFDSFLTNLEISKVKCSLVYDTLVSLSGPDRNKTINKIYRTNAERRRANNTDPELTAEGFIYIVFDAKHYKIGVTKDLESGFQSLKTSTSNDLFKQNKRLPAFRKENS
ncbi:hypothetical protein [Leptospira barantonii]|uniref:GIY-YIG nuclease family protein n=1 Tax=Leptospira barantonii TaxID=2023184 RepID=A0ABX4NN71_9LEPT|nr:hypothetical protein [Leptospira barantonii]PJZ58273.1 hypothetical protein CH367_07795 [Leptospira barantonii]